MIIDCFPFFNELDLLEIRLHELSDVVDLVKLKGTMAIRMEFVDDEKAQ